MYKYPNNTLEASFLLDKVDPTWATKIDLDTLDMEDNEQCILGQLYDCYWDGMSTLFSLDLEDEIEDPYNGDNVFGHTANIEDWKRFIISRLPKDEEIDLYGGVAIDYSSSDYLTGGYFVQVYGEAYQLISFGGLNRQLDGVLRTRKHKVTKNEIEDFFKIKISRIYNVKVKVEERKNENHF